MMRQRHDVGPESFGFNDLWICRLAFSSDATQNLALPLPSLLQIRLNVCNENACFVLFDFICSPSKYTL
jgi:hypothetical protein